MPLDSQPAADTATDEITAALEAFITDASGAERVRIENFTRMSGGAVQENYRLDVEIEGGTLPGHHELVLRTDAPTAVSSSLTRREEFEVLQAVHLAGVPVPEPLWVGDESASLGRAFYLMRRLPGIAAAHSLVRDGVDEDARPALAESLGEALARIHAVRPGFPGLDCLPEPDVAPALARVSSYQRGLDAIDAPHPVLEWGLRWLERRAPPLDEVVLCHGDYRTGNYLVHANRLVGILDWEFAAFSDPYEDIGWLCARCWRFGRLDRELGGVADREPFYRGYEKVSGVTIDRARVPYWEVMATVRWAVIALQQGERYRSGEERTLELALTARMVREMELDTLLQIEEQRKGAAR